MLRIPANLLGMDAIWSDELWTQVRDRLPEDLEESARAWGVLVRRRQITTGEELLRLALLYSVCDLSFRSTAATAMALGIGRMSDVAVMYRLQNLAPWLGHVLGQCLSRRRAAGPSDGSPSVRLVDATSVTVPGPQGGESVWRLHVGLDLWSNRMENVELTPTRRGGETLLRHPVEAGEIVVADRAYSSRKQMAFVMDKEAHLAIRLHHTQVPLWTAEGETVQALSLAASLKEPGEIGDWPVQFRFRRRHYPIRLIALRLDPQGMERGRRRAQERAWKNGHSVSARSLEAAGYLMVLTDLPAESFPAERIVELYQLRWRIETYFKRMKGVLGLDRLRAHTPETVRTYILGKLIATTLLDESVEDWLSLEPEDRTDAPEEPTGSSPPSVVASLA